MRFRWSQIQVMLSISEAQKRTFPNNTKISCSDSFRYMHFKDLAKQYIVAFFCTYCYYTESLQFQASLELSMYHRFCPFFSWTQGSFAWHSELWFQSRDLYENWAIFHLMPFCNLQNILVVLMQTTVWHRLWVGDEYIRCGFKIVYTVIPRKLAVPNLRNSQTRGWCYLVAENPQSDFSLVK